MATANVAAPNGKSTFKFTPRQWITQWFTPRTTDQTVAFRERTIRTLIPIFAALFILALFIPQSSEDGPNIFQPIIPFWLLFTIVFSLLVGTVFTVLAGRIIVAGLLLMGIMALTLITVSSSFGFDNAATLAILYIITALAVVTLPNRLAVLAVLVFIGAIFAVGAFQYVQISQTTDAPTSGMGTVFRVSVLSGFVCLILVAAFQYLRREYDVRVGEVKELAATLEQRVAERTRDLQVAADISLEITTQLDPTQLLADIVQRTADAFQLYHVSIFLFDPADEALKLRQGAGAVGAQMLAEGKQFKLADSGLVPNAARTRQPSLANTVIGDPNHQFNPLLPDTRSELAVPMLYQGALLGVLDIQSDRVNRFSDEDVRIVRALADQIAVAVRNSQLFEETTIAKQEAERADTVKSAFLASMSHELRTPLNAIINFSKFLKRGIPGPINEEQEQLIGSIADSGQHLLNLINDVLDMSKIEAGSLKLFVEPNLDLRAILDTAVTYVRPLLADKPVELQLDLPEALPTLNGDRKRLLQILLNILSNACKFTEAGQVRVRVTQPGDDLLIAITDTGMGIAPSDYDHVFTAFKQTESGLRQGGGTGLGMPISKKLVEAHEGRIWFESEVGTGTTFYVELPIHTALIPEKAVVHA